MYRAAQDVWSDGRTLEQLKESEREVTRAWNAAAERFGVAALHAIRYFERSS